MIIIDFVRDPNMKLPRNQRTSRKESNLLNIKKTNKHYFKAYKPYAPHYHKRMKTCDIGRVVQFLLHKYSLCKATLY